MDGNNLLRYINELEGNSDYCLEPTFTSLTSVLPNENNSIQVDHILKYFKYRVKLTVTNIK
jgi:hypothetical protein